MVGFIEFCICYLFVGLIYHLFFEDNGESRDAIYRLINKSIMWPMNIYNKFIKEKK